ncbi:hypothetical protein OHA27_36800 [Streptomyces sp. NBC_01619]|uniref:hypothetical protein n=1 Tax=Streptomyces sp. NBC_01619 TaxID=2975901 RepID=UPI00224F098F|nr:hypothetical protein [Streptomyces sp. NBC_01619]MCX4515731.1 hypothetical protein [Streptomyces sp. NBC_01619]
MKKKLITLGVSSLLALGGAFAVPQIASAAPAHLKAQTISAEAHSTHRQGHDRGNHHHGFGSHGRDTGSDICTWCR